MGKVKNPKSHSGNPKELRRTDSKEDLLAEIQKLRIELQQIREIVSTLFQMVVEEYDEELDFSPEGREGFSIYN